VFSSEATVRSAELRRFKEQADVSRVRLRQARQGYWQPAGTGSASERSQQAEPPSRVSESPQISPQVKIGGEWGEVSSSASVYGRQSAERDGSRRS
jgi:hypothetical protein